MINFMLWLVLGALVGWLASSGIPSDAQHGTLRNIVVGLVGAFLGGFLFNLLGGGAPLTNSTFSLGALFVSFIGAVVLLTIINMVRHGTVHSP